MNRNRWIILSLLLALNLLGTSYLVVNQVNVVIQNKLQRNISEAQFAQLGKIFKIAFEFRAELENIVGRTSYPKDSAKESAIKYLQDHKMEFEVARIEYQKLLEDRTRATALRFLELCWGGQPIFSRDGVIEIRKYVFSSYDSLSGKHVPYPNADPTKLETLEKEFRILALSLIEDFK